MIKRWLLRPLTDRKLLLLLAAVLTVVAVVRGGWLVALLALPIVYLARHSYQMYVASVEAEHRHAEEVAELHLRTIEALAGAIDAKDDTTHQHLQRVVLYAETIGREMRLSMAEMKALGAAALLHDIGKLAVPEYIISKPGRLTEEEFERMKIHTVVGAEILERVQFPYPVVPIVRFHHERWNGSGYPEGLKGEEIPIGARILAVVDSYDALASDRQYRRALQPMEAIEAVKKEAGVLYDPRVVKILEKIHPRMEALLKGQPKGGTRLSTRIKVEKGAGPRAGLSVEKADTSSALYSITQARQELQVLYELTEALGNSLSVEETIRLLVGQLQKLTPFDALAIYLLRDGQLIPRYAEGVNAELLARLKIPLGEGLSGWVAGNGKSSLNGNPAVEPGYVHDPTQFSRLRSALSVPLDSSKGIIGALTLYSMRYNAFNVDHLRILKAIGAKAGVALHNALIHEAIGMKAQTDGLTGLPNAQALTARLEQEAARAAGRHGPFSLFVVDLNGLKQINDTHGHLAGNRVLKAVAGALRGSLREYDFVGRMGGDEFALILPGMNTEDAAEKRIELAMAVAALNKDFPDQEVSISLGAASCPADGQTVERLMAVADRRMYWHKREYHQARAAMVSARSAVGAGARV